MTPTDKQEMNKDQALNRVAELATKFDLSLQDIATRLAPAETGAQTPTSLLVKVLGYIGGTFVFAGIAIYIGLQWESMNSLARVIVTLGTGFASFVVAMAALQDARYRGLATPLMLISAALEPTGMMVAFAEFGGGGDEQVAALITAATVAAQFGLAFARWRATMMAWLTSFFASAAWGLLLDLLDFSSSVIGLSLGAGWVCVAIALQRGRHAVLSGQLFLFGCWAFLAGLFDQVEGSALESLFVIAACGFVYLGVWAKSRALNFASAAALLAYTAYFTGTYFADSVGWPIALILIGALMIGISTFALRIDRRYLRSA